MSGEDDKATTTRKVVKHGEDDSVFDATIGLKEALKLITGYSKNRSLLIGGNVQSKVVGKTKHVKVAASLIGRRTSWCLLRYFG